MEPDTQTLLVSSRNAGGWGRALGDDTKNGCVADERLPCVKRFTCFDTFSINSLHVIRKDRNDIFNAASNFPTA